MGLLLVVSTATVRQSVILLLAIPAGAKGKGHTGGAAPRPARGEGGGGGARPGRRGAPARDARFPALGSQTTVFSLLSNLSKGPSGLNRHWDLCEKFDFCARANLPLLHVTYTCTLDLPRIVGLKVLR